MQYQTIQTAKGPVGYIKNGHGPAVVMLLRYGATLYNWDQAFITQLSKHFTVYLIEPPLVGETTGNISPDIQGYATLIHDFFEKLSIMKAIFLGWSFGGGVAQIFHQLFPDSVNGMVFISSFINPRLANPEFIQLIFGGDELSKDKKLRMFELMFSEQPTAQLDLAIKNAGLKIENYDYRLTPEVRSLHNKFVLSWAGSDAAVLQAIKVPVLILRSRNDQVFSFDSVHGFIQHIPNSKLINYPKGGHLLIHYCPDEVAQDIINYFK